MPSPEQLDPEPLLAEVRAISDADFIANMSGTMISIVRDYNARCEQGNVVLLRYTASDNGTPRAVLDSGRRLPDAAEIIEFTVSTSVAEAGRISARSELLTAAHRSAFPPEDAG